MKIVLPSGLEKIEPQIELQIELKEHKTWQRE